MPPLTQPSGMTPPALRAFVGAGIVLAALAVHLQVISAAATLSAILLVALTTGVTAAVVTAHVSERDAELTEIRRTLARMREDQVRAKKQSEALIVDEPDE